MSDFNQISTEARDRLIAELHRTVATVSAAVDDAAESVLDAAEADARRADLVAARVEYLAGEGLEPLRRLSGELLERAAELDREVGRLAALATEAAAALRARPPAAAQEPPVPAAEPEPAAVEPEAAQGEPGSTGSELPPILPSLAPESPLDSLDANRPSVAEAPIDFPPRRRRFPEPATRPVEIRPGVRVMVEQLRIAGEPDSAIAGQLEEMGVEDPEAVLAQVRAAERTA